MGQFNLTFTEVDCNMSVLHLGAGGLAVLERWLPNTVAVLDRFHCIALTLSMRSLEALHRMNVVSSEALSPLAMEVCITS